MRKEYDLQTDVLATIVATTPVTPKHAELLTAFATCTEFRGARHVKMRDAFGAQPARVIDANGREIAADYRAWIDAQLAVHGGSVRAVWFAYKEAGYRLVEIEPVLHYFMHDRGGDQDNFVQLEAWEEREFVEREVFPRDLSWGLPDEHELRNGLCSVPVERFERRLLGAPRYRLQAVIDMQQFAAIAEVTYRERRLGDGDRRFVETNRETGEARVISVRDLTPGYDRQQWRGRRFFDDWAASSAGRAGERACLRWAFATSDYASPGGNRQVDFIPWWAHTRKIAELKNTAKLDVYSLYGKLTQFDERIGHRFAWFFYGVHGNLIKEGQMTRVLEAAEAGLIVLPEHDYQVLRSWGDDPYGF
ncbi:hypothetical protein I6G56_01000 (plasmid) [Burkholderia humptydooensis]|uniref:Uncharacterized protein n=2 Tax=Burkholderia humptydooensis TaxID=430531 RepID=A0A7U4P7P1_9BURK|nr:MULTISPECIES: hypothetical protein [Burkholderia]AJY38111.1 hypothetical protein BW21_6248 [Burkholderia sp. 2002721687]ALX44505.1 hypothetical protein AQ610_18275 [Burkholderia humptydooensis]EIP85077.1 hypothetical protein A33K_18350 [Burkholderia humptydooensis MSMB43]QPS41895.1 hypothetical protein I6G56_01000 [Burkholderia humptydooensis]